MPTKSDIIRNCFAAYQTRDRALIEGLISEDFRFTSPYDDEIDRASYFERCWPNSERIRSFDIERIFEQAEGAFVTYKCVTRDGTEFRNTEFFRFEADQISHVDVYFGASYKGGVFIKE